MFSWFLTSALAEDATDATIKTDPTWLQDAVSKFGKTPLEAWITFGALAVLGIVLMIIARSSKKWNAQMLAFGALSIALSFVLSCVRLFRMPNGGSVTPASMLPVMLFSAAYGIGPGFLAGLVYGVLQALQGGVAALGLGQFLLDYMLAFTVLGLAGLAKKLPKKWGLYCAIIIAALARALCHTLAGILFWSTAPWASFVYNITYLGPDTLICIVLAFIIAKPVMRIMKTSTR
ncbi:MAG: energy-coupled thiamine transporter ThiT [Clostridia bacterium]|nr:energy-coupled thiamine transporter ThiT [Clostridia bacterium]